MPSIIDSAYLASSGILAVAASSSRARNDRLSWLALSVGVLLLELMRSAQAGVWMGLYLRDGLHLTGWYDHRRPLQLTCILAFGVALLVALRRWAATCRRGALIFAIGIFCLLAVFAAIRSSSLHWTDALLQQPVGPLTLSQAAQIILLLATSAAALVDIRAQRLAAA